MSGSWSNSTQSLIVLVEQVSGYSGLFAYSPTPAAGNLVLSIAAASGTDPYGNAFAAGLTLYSASGTINMAGTTATWALPDGSGIDITVGPGSVLEEFEPATINGVTWDRGGIGATLQSRLGTNTPLTFVSSPKNHAFAGSSAQVILYGAPQTSNGDVQSEIMLSAARTTVVSSVGWINGAWVYQAATWQAPSYAASWAGSTTFNGSANWAPLQFRRDAEDNCWLVGAFKATGAAGSTVFTLPAGFRPAAQWPMYCHQNNGGTLSLVSLEVGASGNVNLLTQAGASVASGHEYLVNGKFPLGNIS